MDDRTYDPNSQKLDDTKSGYISGTEMATLSARPKRQPITEIRNVQEHRAIVEYT